MKQVYINLFYSMKRIKEIIAVSVLAVTLCGCEGNFDPYIYGSLIQGSFPSTESEYEAFMMEMYVPYQMQWTYEFIAAGSSSFVQMFGNYIQSGGELRMFDTTSDIQGLPATGTEWYNFPRGIFTRCHLYTTANCTTAGNHNQWQKVSGITRMTDILKTLEEADESIFSDGKKAALVAEAHLLRGIMINYLLNLYGPVPMIVSYDDVDNPDAYKRTVRPSLDEMCQWAYDDYDAALQAIPETQSEKGRYNRDYARYLMMRLCLNEGYHMSGWYDKAVEMYEELAAKNKYSLCSDYKSIFSYYNKWNSEIIMAISCSADGTGQAQGGNFNPIAYYSRPTDLQADTTFLCGRGWGQHINVAPWFYDSFDSADKRRECIVTSYTRTNGQVVTSANLGSIWYGYLLNKWPDETLTTYQGHDYILARWADVLLMYAEVLTRRDNTVSPQAVAAVNQVRARAGIGNLSSSATSSVDSFLDAILTERGHELYFEGCRKIDLIRYNRYATQMYATKSVIPTHQYMPLPDYVVNQAAEAGYDLAQEYSRPEWAQDLANAQ